MEELIIQKSQVAAWNRNGSMKPKKFVDKSCCTYHTSNGEYRVELKNPAKVGDPCSVRAEGLSIGCLGHWAERVRED